MKTIRFRMMIILLLTGICCSVYQNHKQIPEFSENPVFIPETENVSETQSDENAKQLSVLTESCPAVIGWITIPDSQIDYPIVQGQDNQYYLSHAPDGREIRSGSIFLDYRCEKDFSDSYQILYGHNMKSGMFGDLRTYREKSAFDSHSSGWIYTRDAVYQIDFFVLSVCSAYDAVYQYDLSVAEWIENLLSHAVCYRAMQIEETDRLIALSTCASDFENARILFVGKLTEIHESSS